MKQGLFSGLFYVTTRTEDSTGDLGSAIQRIWKWLPIFSDSLSPQLSKNNIALLEPKSPWLCCLHQTPPRYPKSISTVQPWTSSRKSVLSKPHFRNRSRYESSKLSMQFFKLEPEILICLPLVPKLIKNQSAVIWKLFEFFEFVM